MSVCLVDYTETSVRVQPCLRVCVFTDTPQRHRIMGKQQKIKQKQIVEALAPGDYFNTR